MSKFIRAIHIMRQFEDDEVRFEAAPMTYSAAMRFRSAQTGEMSETAISNLLREEFIAAITAVEGARDAAGSPVPKEVVLDTAYFGALVLDAALEWMTRSAPTPGK